MKIIDILNKIANEEIPNKAKFKWRDSVIVNKKGTLYLNDMYFNKILNLGNFKALNDEVEIINENKIEKLSYQQIGSYLLERKDYETFTKCVNEQISKIDKKLNDVVETVNYLLEKDNNE